MSTPDAPPRPPRARLLRAFACAGAGLADATLRERNLRIHLALGMLAACATAVLELGAAERGVVLLCIGAVVAVEAINSAVEVIVDVLFPGVDERARFAKDAAAGAVLATAAASVLAGGPVLVSAMAAAVRAQTGERLAIPVAAAAVAALAVARLPGARTRGALATNVAVAAATLALVSRSARDAWGLAAGTLLVALAAGAGGRSLRGRGPPGHAVAPPPRGRGT